MLVSEPGSDLAAELWALDGPAASSVLVYVEIRAALAAARRSDRLSSAQAKRAIADCESLMTELALIGVDEALTRHAGALADDLGLRGYDALHLASALALGEDTTMVTWDRDLSCGALASGCGAAPKL